MAQIKISSKHVKRCTAVTVIAAVLLWFAVPKWMYGNGPDFHIEVPENFITKPPYRSQGSLKFKNRALILDGKPFRIISGAVHYFRILPEYWRDTLMKMKACGLNTVETYVPWNLHEPIPGQYDFEGIHDRLNIRKFIQQAYEVGLYVIFRPGPYICSEWEFGGLPSWLLQDPDMKIRSNYPGYMEAVRKYFSKLIPHIASLQYSKGKNIIAVQIENEFGAYSDEVDHLQFLKELLVKNGIVEMLFISDNKNGFTRVPFYHEALPTANFGRASSGLSIFEYIRLLSPDFPLIVMEFWDGWFDHWGERHNLGLSGKDLEEDLKIILQTGASVNFYMFHGGTNFGFMNGANYFNQSGYQPTITSYDYNSPLSEYGRMTKKYYSIKKILSTHAPDIPTLRGPPIAMSDIAPLQTKAYGEVEIKSFLAFEHMLHYVHDVAQIETPLPMEFLTLQTNHGFSGQSYGYLLYRKYVPRIKKLRIRGSVNDRVQVIWNGKEVAVFDWKTTKYEVDFANLNVYTELTNNTLDLLVENLGRVNFLSFKENRMNNERKGIIGDVLLDGEESRSWTVYSLEFKHQFLNRGQEKGRIKFLNYNPMQSCDRNFKCGGPQVKTFACYVVWTNENYRPMSSIASVPAMYSAEFFIDGEPQHTFLSMEGWKKGVVFINDFNLGRYWDLGPQKTLYVPAAILLRKTNTVRIFEQHHAGTSIKFVDQHELG